MGEKTNWEMKDKSKNLHCSSPQKGSGKTAPKGDSNLMKAGLAIAAGLILAALAKGVKDSDYYD